MSALILLFLSIVFFIISYFVYGRFLDKKFDIDPNRKTPAYTLKDDVDYIPTNKFVLLGHHFSSIAGAGPINGPILASPFGWLAVFLWVLIGTIFFGGVQDFSSLIISVRNKGLSLVSIIENNIGKTGKKLFMIFCFFTLILVIAAFADIVASTFNGFSVDGTKIFENGATSTSSILFIFSAILFGYFVYKNKVNLFFASIIGIIALILCVLAGFLFPLFIAKGFWIFIIFVYIYIASILPVWILLQPRDYLSSFLLYATIILAILGIIFYNPIIVIPAFTSFSVNGQFLFPMLFVTVACGAISGFHSVVSSGTTAKQLENEKDARFIGFGAMIIEGILAVISIIAVSSLAKDSPILNGTPTQIFASAISQFTLVFGIPVTVTSTVLTLAISSFALTSLDTCARLARYLLEEFFIDAEDDRNNLVYWKRIVTNKYVSTFITLIFGIILALIGYKTIWGLFGASNQLLAAIALLTGSVWLKNQGKKSKILFIPMVFMLITTLTALSINFYTNLKLIYGGSFSVGIIQCFFSMVLFVLAVCLSIQGTKIMFKKNK
jgi:carbon starvation protein